MLVCEVIAPEKVHPKMFKGANKMYHPAPTRKIAKEKHNKPMTEERQQKTSKRLVSKETKKRKRLAELGVEYDFPGYKEASKELKGSTSTVNEEKPAGEGDSKPPVTKKRKVDNTTSNTNKDDTQKAVQNVQIVKEQSTGPGAIVKNKDKKASLKNTSKKTKNPKT